jgi:hypothetical protein
VGLLRLALGDYRRGWEDFEARWEIHAMWRQQRGHGTEKETLPPRWDGKSPGKVLLYAEQGSGDTLWALRYVGDVPDCVLMVQPELVTLVQALTNKHTVANGNSPLCQWSAPLMSLPFILKDFAPRPPRIALNAWRGPASMPLRVGVCWHGESKHGNDKDRSCPESLLPHVASIPGVEAISLQHGEPTIFASFLDTAMLMHSLHLVVTVDTAIAHLAGTLGVPTIVIPPTVPDWRWPGAPMARTPWYPNNLNLARRNESKDWSGAIALTLSQIRGMIDGTSKA